MRDRTTPKPLSTVAAWPSHQAQRATIGAAILGMNILMALIGYTAGWW